MQLLVIDEPALNIGKLVEYLKKFGDHSDLSELAPSPNIPMQADTQICQIIVEDLMSFVDSIEGYAKVDRQCIRDRFFRIVAGKLLHR